MTRTLGTTLDTAKSVITGGRQDDYGNPEDSFGRIASLWSGYLGYPFTKLDVAHMMILLKVARCIGQAPAEDNYVDIAGYAAIAADRIVGEVKK